MNSSINAKDSKISSGGCEVQAGSVRGHHRGLELIQSAMAEIVSAGESQGRHGENFLERK